jgi:hypothetical protein
MKERLIGLGALTLGVLIGYWSVYEPLAKADSGAGEVSLSQKGAFLCPVIIGIGAMYLLLGARVKEILGTREEPKPASYIIGVLLLGAGIALYFGVKSKLQDRGYEFRDRWEPDRRMRDERSDALFPRIDKPSLVANQRLSPPEQHVLGLAADCRNVIEPLSFDLHGASRVVVKGVRRLLVEDPGEGENAGFELHILPVG